jgi:hypothetical protein
MVNNREIRQKIHEEKMAKQRVRIAAIQKDIKKKQKLDAEYDSHLVHNEYIDYLRKHKLPITQADITKSIRPPHKKLGRDADFGIQMLEAQYNGIIDGLKIHIAFILFCILILLWPLEWSL